MPTKKCEHCDGEFELQSEPQFWARTKYCSLKCRETAHCYRRTKRDLKKDLDTTKLVEKLRTLDEARRLPTDGRFTITRDGRVFSEVMVIGQYRELKLGKTSGGYLRFHTVLGPMHVHRAVMETFIGPLGFGLVTRHLDGDPTNNRLENLTYGTEKENGADAVRHGRSQRGQKQHLAKFTEDDVRAIRKAFAAGTRICDLARAYGANPSTLGDIVQKRTWAWVGG